MLDRADASARPGRRARWPRTSRSTSPAASASCARAPARSGCSAPRRRWRSASGRARSSASPPSRRPFASATTASARSASGRRRWRPAWPGSARSAASIATPGRVGFGAVALGIGAVGTHALALAPLGLQSRASTGRSCRWSPRSPVPCGGCMIALGAFFRGGDRTKPATLGWQTTVGAGPRRQPGRQPAARPRRRRPRRADRLAPRRPARRRRRSSLFASVGSMRDPAVVGLLFSVLEARLRRSLRRAETELQRRELSRRPDRPAEPPDVRRHARAGGAAGRRHARAAGDAVHRPRRLQADQRVARPRHRRPGAARDRGAPEALRAARRTASRTSAATSS